jgi:hypothetical protein
MFMKSIIQRLCKQILELISSASSSFYTSSNESSLLNYPNNDDRNNDDEDNDDNDKKQFRQWNEVVCSLFRRDGIANRTHSLISIAEQSSPCFFANKHRQQQQYERSLGCGVTFLQHIQQDCTWDCGISCLEMVILWLTQSHNGTFNDKNLGLNECDHSVLRSWMIQTVATESIWTIDLLYVLRKLLRQNDAVSSSRTTDETVGAKDYEQLSLPMFSHTYCSYLMCTRSMMIKNEYETLQYYTPKFREDRIRIAQRLQQILKDDNMISSSTNCANCCCVQQFPYLTTNQIIHCIRNKNCVAIALIDNHAFTSYRQYLPSASKTLSTASPPRSTHETLSKHTPTQYVGHYIILTGISYDTVHVKQARVAAAGLADMTNNKSTTNMTVEPSQFKSVHGYDENCCLVVQNPSNSVNESPNFITLSHFEYAWKAYGTDDDIIFIVRHDS